MKFSLPKSAVTYVPFLILAVVLTFIFPRAARFGYEYKKGSPWQYETLFSQFDFPIYKTEEQIQTEKSRSVTATIPYYKFSEDVVNKNIKAAESLSLGSHSALKAPLVAAVRELYAQGIVSDEGVKLDRNVTDLSTEVLYIQKDKRAIKKPASEVYKLSDAKAKLIAEMGRNYKSYNLDSIFKAHAVYDLIVPDLVYDKQTTELVHAESGKVISPTQGVVNAGQLIVSSGEIITSEIEQMLDSYKIEYEANLGYSGPKVLMWLGNFLIALSICLIFYLCVYFTNQNILAEPKRLLYMILVFLISTVATLSVGRSYPQALFMVPFTLTALWLQAFFRNQVVIVVYSISLLPLMIFSHAGVALYVMYLLAGVVAIYAFRYFNRGWMQFITALITFAVLLLSYVGCRLTDMLNGNVTLTVLHLFIGSLLTVLGYPLIYLFERLFNLVSNSRLMELADTSNPLLRDLEAKAPGTFQHSLQVMSMSDFVARSIGANALLVRAGALYHDIGKMNNPFCFVENDSLNQESGIKYHDGLSPRQSARDIIAHVTDGLEIAEKHRLPEVIKDFILTHHGTTCTTYFYNKYLNEGGDPEYLGDFYYKGRKPTTKEQIIVMLCDTIEAASRTLKTSSPEAFSDFVEKMVDTKMNAGQFDEADISIKQLNAVKDSLKAYLAQLYHERVVYPKRKGR